MNSTELALLFFFAARREERRSHETPETPPRVCSGAFAIAGGQERLEEILYRWFRGGLWEPGPTLCRGRLTPSGLDRARSESMSLARGRRVSE